MKRLFEATRRKPDEERCELCALPLPARHDHLYELRARAVRCACTGCALIVPTSERSLYRRIPVRRDAVAIDLDAWLARLGSPVGIAAIVARDDGRTTVSYPGPAGLAETDLDLDVAAALDVAIRDASAGHHMVGGADDTALAREVEALVIANLPSMRGAWIVGIDVVFKMIAELRASWEGMTGGQRVGEAIARALEAAP